MTQYLPRKQDIHSKAKAYLYLSSVRDLNELMVILFGNKQHGKLPVVGTDAMQSDKRFGIVPYRL